MPSIFEYAEQCQRDIAATQKGRISELEKEREYRNSIRVFSENIKNSIEEGQDINGLNASGINLLCFITFKLKLSLKTKQEMIVFLVQGLGANINSYSKHIAPDRLDGGTLLHLLLQYGNPTIEFVKFLLENGADHNATNERREAPLHCLAKDCSIPPSNIYSFVKLFLEIPTINTNARNNVGETALYCLLRYNSNYSNFLCKQVYSITELFLQHKADVNMATGAKKTPLHRMAMERCAIPIKDRSGFVKLLLRNGADPNARGRNGKTPLHGLVMLYHTSPDAVGYVIKLLLKDQRTNVNAEDMDGRTPLFYAAHQNCHFKNVCSLINLLLKNGANVNILDRSGKTPLSYALSEGVICKEIKEFLERKMLEARATELAHQPAASALPHVKVESTLSVIDVPIALHASPKPPSPSGPPMPLSLASVTLEESAAMAFVPASSSPQVVRNPFGAYNPSNPYDGHGLLFPGSGSGRPLPFNPEVLNPSLQRRAIEPAARESGKKSRICSIQ